MIFSTITISGKVIFIYYVHSVFRYVENVFRYVQNVFRYMQNIFRYVPSVFSYVQNVFRYVHKVFYSVTGLAQVSICLALKTVRYVIQLVCHMETFS